MNTTIQLSQNKMDEVNHMEIKMQNLCAENENFEDTIAKITNECLDKNYEIIFFQEKCTFKEDIVNIVTKQLDATQESYKCF